MTIVVLNLYRYKFQEPLPAGINWNKNYTKLVVDDRYTLLTDDRQITRERPRTDDKNRNVLRVNNLRDLESTKDLLLSKPLLTTVKCPLPDVSKVKYLVIVLTSSPEVKSVVRKMFNMAKSLLLENKRFVITFNLDATISSWYFNSMADVFCYTESMCKGANFYLTHEAREKCIFAQEYIDCYMNKAVLCWFLCCPLCLVIGCPYVIYRHILRGIEDIKYSASLTVIVGEVDDSREEFTNCSSRLFHSNFEEDPNQGIEEHRIPLEIFVESVSEESSL
ncbi:uncharacterized protein LOC124453344 [Xenia sp. Carnegie-2017]|uniref:uncharacterized protein LOC124453344 n=1 Tax=Xenia sp. Carnegie-2017 TaxID=2897299 RepID=UPI001F033EE3|nr:uncharacterized protein LOC124453344 [Xenia sp. Carnegie-2017]